MTRQKLQRGVHRSVVDLNANIMSSIDAHNEKPNPDKWVTADETLASVRRCRLKANELGEGEDV